MGGITIESAIWRDIQKEKALEEQKQKEQMPRKMRDRLQWGRERSREYNMQQIKTDCGIYFKNIFMRCLHIMIWRWIFQAIMNTGTSIPILKRTEELLSSFSMTTR